MENGGFWSAPRRRPGRRGRARQRFGAAGGRSTRVISSTLATSLTGLMTHVVTAVPSYLQATFIPGYYVGGKTGTAQVWDATLDGGKGGWLADIYNYSFYGWIGTSSPDLTIVW